MPTKFVLRIFCIALLPLSVLPAGDGPGAYAQLKRFELTAAVDVHGLVLKKDRIEITLDGKLFLEKPVAGFIRGAVFIGNGKVRIENPPVDFEKGSVKRAFNVDTIDATFRTAVFRASGEILQQAGAAGASPQAPSADAKELAEKFEPKLLRKTGLNVGARIARAIANDEKTGFLLVEFDKTSIGRFSAVFDEEGQVPSTVFDLNAGEKGLVFRYVEPIWNSDIVLSFLSKADYESGRFQYSDVFNPTDVEKYTMRIDATEAGKRTLRNDVTITGQYVRDTASLFFGLNDGMGEAEDPRRKRSMDVKSASDVATGKPLTVVQEPWEIGATVFLNQRSAKGQPLNVTLETEGKPLFTALDRENMTRRLSLHGNGAIVSDSSDVPEDIFYPTATTAWYPRLGYLDRAQFEMIFRHRKGFVPVTVGRQTGNAAEATGGIEVTTWRTERAVPFAGFGIGRFNVATGKAPKTNTELRYYTPSLGLSKEKQTFLMTEFGNGVDFFSELFGSYPYGELKGVYHPRPFGQGFSTLVFLPPMSRAESKPNFHLISHEISHQWWGNQVSWRSYRDQWLSEGFAEYGAALYIKARMDRDAMADVVRWMRTALTMPPVGVTGGVAKGRLADLGPLILGRRLVTEETLNAYTALTYAKGGAVLRMVHFLLSNPADGKDSAFFDMLRDFVKRYQDRPASTEGFANVASEYFVKSPIGRKYSFGHLGWFFRQWVYEAHLPSYRLEYKIEKQSDGKALLKGTLYQEETPENWEMPLPLVVKFDNNEVAKGSVLAKGPASPVSLPLPAMPKDVQLDPDAWVLSAKTTAVRLQK